jgi:hypothetical protein
MDTRFYYILNTFQNMLLLLIQENYQFVNEWLASLGCVACTWREPRQLSLPSYIVL